MKRPAIVIFSREQYEREWLSELLFPKYSFISTADHLKASQLCKQQRQTIFLLAPSMMSHNFISFIRGEFPLVPIIGTANEKSKPDFITEAYLRGLNDYLEKPDKKSLIQACKKAEKSREAGKFKWPFRFNFFPASGKQLLSEGNIPLNNSGTYKHANVNIASTPIVENGKRGKHAKPLLKVSFFGNFHIELNQKPVINLNSRKGRSILIYLLFHQRKQTSRDVLMDKFWPHVSADSARNSLNVAIHSIRKAFYEIDPDLPIIVYKDECYTVQQDIQIESDVARFTACWQQAKLMAHQGDLKAASELYEAAITYYKGEFIEEDLYTDWAIVERENLHEIYLLILDRLSDYHMHNHQFKKAMEYCQTLLKMDNCREDVHRRLMHCYSQTGKRGQAIMQYHKCKKILKKDLEVDPSPRTIDLFNQIRS